MFSQFLLHAYMSYPCIRVTGYIREFGLGFCSFSLLFPFFFTQSLYIIPRIILLSHIPQRSPAWFTDQVDLSHSPQLRTQYSISVVFLSIIVPRLQSHGTKILSFVQLELKNHGTSLMATAPTQDYSTTNPNRTPSNEAIKKRPFVITFSSI